ncbi:MAG: hypothetical protein ACK5Q1_13005, partial [Limnobacter sp.]
SWVGLVAFMLGALEILAGSATAELGACCGVAHAAITNGMPKTAICRMNCLEIRRLLNTR